MSSRHRIGVALVGALASASIAVGCGRDTETPTQADASLPLTSTPTTTAPTVPTTTQTAPAPSSAERAAKRAQRARIQQRKRRAAARRRAEAKTETSAETPPAEDAPSESPATEQPEATQSQPPPEPTGPPAHTVTEQATLHLVSKRGSRSFVHEGTVEGTLAGTMNLRTRFGGEGIIGDFVVTLSDGTLRGRASGELAIAGSKANFKGSAQILGGTGAYAKASATGLAFSGHVASDASRSFVRMSGPIRW